MSKELKIPKNTIIDDKCIEMLGNHLRDYVINQTKRYTSLGIDIYLHSYYFRIKYNHHTYYVVIIEENNEYYWYLKPYNKSYFTTIANYEKSFELVIQAVLDINMFIK